MEFITVIIVLVVIIAIIRGVYKASLNENNSKKSNLSKQRSSNPKKLNSNTAIFQQKDVGNRLRIIYESAKIVENTSNFTTFRSRVNLMVEHMRNFSNFREGYLQEVLKYYESISLSSNTAEYEYQALLNEVIATHSNNVCPYCNHNFDKEVIRKRKCPSCKEQIYIVKDENKNRYLVKEDENSLLQREIPQVDKQLERNFIQKFPIIFKAYEAYFLEEYIYPS